MANNEHQLPLDHVEKSNLPVVEVLTGRGFITGKSGSGKSNSASVIIEELLDRGFPVLIVDTDGEYWGLKEEYEILHVGADEECDLQVGPEHAEKLAELALDKSVPIILDVSGYLDQDEASGLVRETASELFIREKKLNRPFLMLVEEVHEYIPEGSGLDDTGQMLIRVAKRGRKRGLGLCGISQRPADVKKDFITQCDWLMWHRLTWENDTSVVRRVVDSTYADAVQDLDDGEAFLMADFLETDITRVQVRRKHTFDAGATPDLGEYERPELKTVSGDLVEELEEISQREERRQDRIAELEQRLEEKNEQISELEDELASAQDMRNLAQQMAEGLQATGDSGVASEKMNELVEERNELRRKVEEQENQIETLNGRVQELQEYEEKVELLESLDLEEASEAITRLQSAIGIESDREAQKWRQKYQQSQKRVQELEQMNTRSELTTNPLENGKVERLLTDINSRIDDLRDVESQMLRYYMQEGPCEVKDAYKYTGNSPSSHWKEKHNEKLAEADLIHKVDDGTWDCAIDDYVEEKLVDYFDDEEIQIVINEVEDLVKHSG